jgi:hypothetical protein
MSSSYANRGLRELQDRLRALGERTKAPVPLTEALSPAFMAAHTRFPTFEAFIEAGSFGVQTAEDFLALPAEPWDAHVRAMTPFASWAERQQVAGREWIARQLRPSTG